MHACSKHQVVHRYGGPLLELLQALEGCGFTLGHAAQAQDGRARGWRDQLDAVQAESKGAGTANDTSSPATILTFEALPGT
jgi:hypothetical protein